MVALTLIDVVVSAGIVLVALRVAYWILQGLKEEKHY